MTVTASRRPMTILPPMAVPSGLIRAAAVDGIPEAILRADAARLAGRGLVLAAGNDPDAASAIQALSTGLADFKAKFGGRLDAMEEHVNKEVLRAAATQLNGGVGLPGDDPEYRKTFASYFQKGASEAEASLKTANASGQRATIQAAMSVGDNSSGGYLAPVEWDRKVNVAQRAKSPMRQIARVVQTSVGAYSTLWSNDQWGSGWVGETASRPVTTTASLTPLIFPTGEIYAMPAATQRLLDDAALDVEEWLARSLADEFDRQEGIAFVSGDGINKPAGFLTYAEGGSNAAAHPGGAISVDLSGSASDITPEVLVTFKYRLPAPYRQNAVWLMNSQTAGYLSKMKDADGRFIWSESLITGQPSTLLGQPVKIDENMPNVGAGAMPIAFGDFLTGYVINDRIGIRVLRDPYSNKPYVLFYTTKRVGAGVADPRAIRLLKVAAS